MRGIHQWPVNSPHKGPVTRRMFPFDDVIMDYDHMAAIGLCTDVIDFATHTEKIINPIHLAPNSRYSYMAPSPWNPITNSLTQISMAINEQVKRQSGKCSKWCCLPSLTPGWMCKYSHLQTSNIRRTKSQNQNVSCLAVVFVQSNEVGC